MLGMFYVFFGAAAGGSAAVYFWPAIVLFVIGALLLSFFSGLRASQIGLPPMATGIAAILMCGVGPFIPVLVIYLTVKKEAEGQSAPAPASTWAYLLVLLIVPWLFLWAIKHLAAGS